MVKIKLLSVDVIQNQRTKKFIMELSFGIVIWKEKSVWPAVVGLQFLVDSCRINEKISDTVSDQ